jgi:hypothetical protein
MHTLPHDPQLVASDCTSTQLLMPPAVHVIRGAAHPAWQFPATQVSLEAHECPHVPQFARSLEVSTHALPQRICPLAHVDGTHVAPSHISVPPHARPHIPQFADDVVVSTHDPPQSI